jgi:hypothetical protein
MQQEQVGHKPRVFREDTFLLTYNAQLILHSGPLQFHATLEAASTTAVSKQEQKTKTKITAAASSSTKQQLSSQISGVSV